MHKFEEMMALSAEAERMSLEGSRNAALLMSSHVNTLQTSMNEFMQAVSTMEDTVMVPSMLRDIAIIRGVDGVTKCTPVSSAASLYHFYAMLRSMKTELARGLPGASDISSSGSGGTNGKSHQRQRNGHNGQRRHTLQANAPLNAQLLPHQHHPPTNGINGTSGHGTTPAHLIDANTTDRAVLMADDFRAHMSGLLQTLHELTTTAHYVTQLYKQEVGDN